MDEALTKHCRQTLKKNNLEPIKKLGKGSYGIVFLVSKAAYECQLYSVKCTYKKQFVKKPFLRRFLKQQIALMESLEHQNIVKLVRTFEDDGWIFMLMEYCDLGNIATIQSHQKSGLFPFQQCCSIVEQLIQGLTYMHSHNIIHRDIKPENILRKKTKNTVKTKICDFGFCHEGIYDANTFCGTTYYMAPEIFQNTKYDWKVDVWAVGVLIYTMLFGVVPFNGLNMLADIQNKCEGGFNLAEGKLKVNSSINRDKMRALEKLFKAVFQINPEKRCSLLQISEILNLKAQCSQRPEPLKRLQTVKTMDTDNSEEESPKQIDLQIDKVWFIQMVLDKVSSLEYLQPMQFLTLKFYLDKVCLSTINCMKEEKKKDKKLISRLMESQQRDTHILQDTQSTIEVSEMKEIKIRKSFNFQQYKEQYRLVVGHAFYKAHKCIKNQDLKVKTKLVLLCCHLINRVFEKEYRKDLFQHYFKWSKKNSGYQVFELRKLADWIQEEDSKHISETIERINKKFYHKGNH